jgi:hypothetical protein
MVFMWSLFSPLLITRPNGGVLDLNLGTQVPRRIIYKTILPNLHDHFAKSTWPVCKSTWPLCRSTCPFCKNPHDHYVNLHDHSAKIHMTIMWICMTILPNPHDHYVNLHEHSAKSTWQYVNLHDHSAKIHMTIMWIYMTILQNPHDYSCKSTWSLRKIHMTIRQIKIITVIKCATEWRSNQPSIGCPLWLSCGWTSIELATLKLLVGR